MLEVENAGNNVNAYLKDYLKNNLTSQFIDDGLLVNGIDYVNENSFFDGVSTEELGAKLMNLYKINKKVSSEMMKKKRGTIVFLFEPQLYKNFNSGRYSPIYNQAKLSFMKSMAKEFNPFNINVLGIVIGVNKEKKQIEFAKEKKLDVVQLKLKTLTIEQQCKNITTIIENAKIFRGQCISVESNIPLYI